MKSVVNAIRTFVKSEDGPTAVEYGVLVALIILVAITGITALGTKLNALFTDIGNKIKADATSET